MKKEMLKRSLALGMLMAFVITGNAMAENVEVAKGSIKNDTPAISVGAKEHFTNAGTVNAEESIKIDGGKFTNNGTINTKILDIREGGYSQNQGHVPIAGSINASEKVVYRGFNDAPTWGGDKELSSTIKTDLLHIIGKHNSGYKHSQTGLVIKNNDVLKGVKNILIENAGDTKTGLIFDGKNLNIQSNIILKNYGSVLTKQDARVEIENGSNVTFKSITSDTKNKLYKTVIQANGRSTAEIENLIVEDNSRILLNGLYNKNYTGPLAATFKLNNITVKEGAELRAGVWSDLPDAYIKGNLNIDLAKNAIVDFSGFKNKDWLGDKIHVNADSLTVRVADVDSLKEPSKYGYGGSGVFISYKSEILKNADKISIIADGKNNTGNAKNDLEKASYAVRFTKDPNAQNGFPELIPCAENGIPAGMHVEQEYNDIYDGAKGITDGKCGIEGITIIDNPNTHGIRDISNNALMAWRAENDDMNKRLGELRDSTGEHGVWVRMIRGEGDYESINYNHNTYQLGYDEKLSTDPSWTLGAALTYTEGDSTFSTGSGENKHKGLVLYGSKLNDDGSYLDLVAKYARLDHDFDVTGDLLSGEYEANGYSVSAEYGKRFRNDKGLWIEPQIQFTYGHVGSADYVSKAGRHIMQDGMESLVGRLGFLWVLI